MFRHRVLAGFVLLATITLVSCQTQSPTTTNAGHKGQGSDVDLLQAVQRPIEEFVNAQGTFCFDDGMGGCFLFVPPAENFFGWGDPAKGICAAFDYAGLANKAIKTHSGGAIDLGTTTSGSVTERPLADGRAEIHVILHTRNANTFGQSACNNFNTDPLTFGHRPADVIAGAEPALGNGTFQVKFIIPAPGAPLPDLFEADLTMVSIYFTAFGKLHAASGFAAGTPGRLTCTQTGLFFTGFHGAVGDGFPAENIDVQPVGHGRGTVK